MGRGRAKAKQTKVARQLKYNSGGTDLDALRRELIGDSNGDGDREPQDDDREPQDDDPYAAYADDDWDDDDASRR